MSSEDFQFKRFLKQHDRWLTFAGAFILFMTFIVKEGLMDHWKETANAIDAAQYNYNLHLDLHNRDRHLSLVDSQLRNIREDISSLRGDRYDTSKMTLIDAFNYEMADRMDTARTATSEAEATLTLLDILAGVLPVSDRNRESLKKLHADVVTEQTYIYDLETAAHFLSRFPVARKWTPELMKRSETAIEKAETMQQALAALDNGTTAIADELRKDAEETRLRNKFYARLAWWVSAALFALGWGLGLLGKVYGISAPGAEE